ncbi:MAG: cysteine--tRNA ligase [Candidatus Pacearchaeota archaeon]
MLKLYNTLSKRLEIFKPLRDKEVRIYSCGPTVYDHPHIGNYRAFVFVDLLKRYLLWKGYRVRHVMNITDVDDKIIKKVNESGKSLKEITRFYEAEFKRGLKELNCILADFYPRATEHIAEMQALIQKLLDRGYAYLSEDGIYYDISKFKDYGKLSGLDIAKLKAGARVAVQEYSKEQASDFVLWKAWREEDGSIFWQPEFVIDGKKIKIKGRPGWHIECSAMSMKYLGESFDIHSGGIDLIFPHHENEIAQSEAATGKRFVKYWLHNAHLIVEGKKMSKSLGNYYTLKDLLERGYSGAEIRYVLLACHYREELNFKFSELEAARRSIGHIIETLERLGQVGKKEVRKKGKKKNEGQGAEGVADLIKKAREEFEKAFDVDLNAPKALSVFFSFIRETNKLIDAGLLNKKEAKLLMKFIYEIDRVFGIGFEKLYKSKKKLRIPRKIRELVEKREKARKARNFELADRLRQEIKELGWWVDDTPIGPKIKKLSEN